MKATPAERTKGVCSPPSIPLPAVRVDASVEMVGVLKRASEPVCICDFTAAFALSQPTISHHVGKLREAGLVEVTKSGIWAYYRLARNLDVRTRAVLDALV